MPDAPDELLVRLRRGGSPEAIDACWVDTELELGIFVSSDLGRSWRRSPEPAYSTTVPEMTGPGWSGQAVTFARRERPELHFDAVTGAPTHLLTGVMQGGAGPAKKWQLSYSVATRLGKKR